MENQVFEVRTHRTSPFTKLAQNLERELYPLLNESKIQEYTSCITAALDHTDRVIRSTSDESTLGLSAHYVDDKLLAMMRTCEKLKSVLDELSEFITDLKSDNVQVSYDETPSD